MPPKESAKQKKDREKAEKAVAQMAQERQDTEIDEDKARQLVELTERMSRLEITNEFFERMVSPGSRLMVRRTDYDAIRKQMQVEAAASADRVLSMQTRFHDMQRSHSVLLQELAHLRGECKRLASTITSETGKMRGTVADALQECVASIEGEIVRHRRDAAECAQHLNLSLEESRLRAVKMADEALRQAQKVTQIMQEHTSMHTRIPARIRSALQRLEKDELMLILDTLSFEDAALQYLMYRFPPGHDDPFNAA